MAQSAVPRPEPTTDPPDRHLKVVPDPPNGPAPDIHVHTIECSPLYETHGERPGWTGRIVTDPDEIRAIRKRVEAGAAGRGAWRRRLARIRRGR